MVSVKQGNNSNKRRGSGKPNKRYKPAINGLGLSRNHIFNNHGGSVVNTAMININQFPDNPGYVDFNKPSPAISEMTVNKLPVVPINSNVNSGGTGGNNNGRGRSAGGGKMNDKGRFRRGGNTNTTGGHPIKERNNSNNNTLNYNSNSHPRNRRSGGGQQRHNNSNGHGSTSARAPLNRGYRNNFVPARMIGPMLPPSLMRSQPIPPPPPPPISLMNGRFGPRPFLPPLSSSSQSLGARASIGSSMGRSVIRGGGGIPPLIGPMPLLRNRRSIRNGHDVVLPPPTNKNRRNLRNRKRAANTQATGTQMETNKQNVGGGGNEPNLTKKTLKEIVNEYSLEKPWITDEIKDLAKIKLDIENRLKGKKDDKLFAEFKIQRDKFVTIYEAAKKQYLEQPSRLTKDNGKTSLTVSTKTNSK